MASFFQIPERPQGGQGGSPPAVAHGWARGTRTVVRQPSTLSTISYCSQLR